ncbi:hypothetical protein GQ42DRAFT_68501 [Ramicandelaber brevisporus]|nr:hypothetical protein GQ42DRAFT_68501 [Ramicandelaber brevisporus]
MTTYSSNSDADRDYSWLLDRPEANSDPLFADDTAPRLTPSTESEQHNLSSQLQAQPQPQLQAQSQAQTPTTNGLAGSTDSAVASSLDFNQVLAEYEDEQLDAMTDSDEQDLDPKLLEDIARAEDLLSHLESQINLITVDLAALERIDTTSSSSTVSTSNVESDKQAETEED